MFLRVIMQHHQYAEPVVAHHPDLVGEFVGKEQVSRRFWFSCTEGTKVLTILNDGSSKQVLFGSHSIKRKSPQKCSNFGWGRSEPDASVESIVVVIGW